MKIEPNSTIGIIFTFLSVAVLVSATVFIFVVMILAAVTAGGMTPFVVAFFVLVPAIYWLTRVIK